jgi:AbrB family looped-hinge helix DNA binding protein
MHRIATVQTRGRVTLPARIRQALQIAPGGNVVFVETAAGRFEVKAEARTAALLNRRPTTRLEVPVGRRAPQLQLPLSAGEHTSANTGR